MVSPIKIIECPRDAMQGWKDFIPTEQKIEYINKLLKVGFDTIDFGSFVSPKAIPHLKDSAEVLAGLDMKDVSTKLLAIVANTRGAVEALEHSRIDYLGFPFSVSEEFQKRNTNSTIDESLNRVREIQKLCLEKNRTLVIYISMGFGNPYGEAWSEQIVTQWVVKLADIGIKIIALSDTVGVSNPQNISQLFSYLIPKVPHVEFGAHLHSHKHNWSEKVAAAYDNGCRRFDSAMAGIGGCPMADDKLVGNLATEELVNYFDGPANLGLDEHEFHLAMQMAKKIFQS
ncbi:MAG TPA: hydroxymethylglutaryl-CoA lyase [Bacteroidia bacterium]|nr:hydroxymethylglutaryl-CoA lyase [Bacteroidia bacterium]